LLIPCLLFATHGTPLRVRDMLRVTFPAVLTGLIATLISLTLSSYYEGFPHIVRFVIGSALVVTIYGLAAPILFYFSPAKAEYASVLDEAANAAKAFWHKLSSLRGLQ